MILKQQPWMTTDLQDSQTETKHMKNKRGLDMVESGPTFSELEHLYSNTTKQTKNLLERA